MVESLGRQKFVEVRSWFFRREFHKTVENSEHHPREKGGPFFRNC